jgi:hypothetical protein
MSSKHCEGNASGRKSKQTAAVIDFLGHRLPAEKEC